MKQVIKHYIKHSQLFFNIITGFLYIYLKFAYFTSKWEFIISPKIDKENLYRDEGILFALWHNRLAYSIYIFGKYKNVFGLTSPHSDGKIISKLILMMGYKIIEGSSNKNSTRAVREIIKQLKNGGKVVVTPDGPRGPIYKNGSIITKIASKQNIQIIPVSCSASNYFQLRSWDKMMFPKPFSKILVLIGQPLVLKGNQEEDRLLLEKKLNDLSNQADNQIK